MPEIFFFNDTATTEIYTLSLHDALPITRPATGNGPPGSAAHEPAGIPPRDVKDTTAGPSVSPVSRGAPARPTASRSARTRARWSRDPRALPLAAVHTASRCLPTATAAGTTNTPRCGYAHRARQRRTSDIRPAASTRAQVPGPPETARHDS